MVCKNMILNKIQNKQLVLIGQGPSSGEIAKQIDCFRNKDVLWGSLNRYHVFENEVLRRINRRFDVLWCSSNVRFNEMNVHLRESSRQGALIMTTTRTSLRINFTANIY